MRISELISNWSTKRWARDDALPGTAPRIEAEDLRLRWFGSPDDEGWFRIIATDSAQHDWSAFCRITDPAKWPALELALGGKLRASIAEIGAVELEESAESDLLSRD